MTGWWCSEPRPETLQLLRLVSRETFGMRVYDSADLSTHSAHPAFRRGSTYQQALDIAFARQPTTVRQHLSRLPEFKADSFWASLPASSLVLLQALIHSKLSLLICVATAELLENPVFPQYHPGGAHPQLPTSASLQTRFRPRRCTSLWRRSQHGMSLGSGFTGAHVSMT